MLFRLKMPAIGANKRKRPGRVAFLVLPYDYAMPISSTSKMRVESPGMPVCMLFYPLFNHGNTHFDVINGAVAAPCG